MIFRTNKEEKRNIYSEKNRYLGLSIIFLSFIVLIIRSFYGFCWSDESFYLSTVHRLYLGDRLLIDEWNPAQFYAVLLLPIYKLFIFITGSTDGVYLYARIVSNIIILGVAAYLYHVLLKKYSMGCAVIASLLFMFFSRSNVDGLSYHNLTTAFGLLGATVLFNVYISNSQEKNHYFKLFFAGIVLACAVVCNPYLVIAYFITSLLCCVIYKKIGLKRLILIWSGSLFAAILYIIWLLRRQGISETMAGIPNLFRDSEHTAGIYDRFIGWFKLLLYTYKWSIIITFFLCMIAIIRHILTKDHISHILQIILFLCNIILLIYSNLININIRGGGYIALTLFGTVLFLLIDNISSDIKGTMFFYILGIIISLLQYIASNGGCEIVAVGLVISSIACIIWCEAVLNELLMNFNMSIIAMISRIITYTAIIICLMIIVIIRIKCVYRDDSLTNLTRQIHVGPAKGVFTTEEHYAQYMDVYNIVKAVEEDNSDGDKYIFCSRLAPWIYLCTNMKCGAYTTWRIAVDDEHLLGYYQNIGYFPDYVLVLDEDYGNYTTEYLLNTIECTDANANSFNGYFADILLNDSLYEKTQVVCGVLYKKI